MSRQFDHSSRQEFYDYYAKTSQEEKSLQRFISVRDCVLRVMEKAGRPATTLEVADIGCGAGSQCMVWAEMGHHVYGLDVNQPLLDLAGRRANERDYSIEFRLGSATDLPWADSSMDVCVVLELLEHVVEWKACLGECTRILKPGGILVLTTTNRLCPIQEEFTLPWYSWYPSSLKRYFEHRAVTTHPQIANHARYPAVNWFSFYGLRAWLKEKGLDSFDRFDVMDIERKGWPARAIVKGIRSNPVLRWFAHVGTPGTFLVGVKPLEVPN